MPSANVVVSSSATPSTAATISQTIHAIMAAPQRWVPHAVSAAKGAGTGGALVPSPQR
jgi:hypothetical protein